jgi:hypothetical protein
MKRRLKERIAFLLLGELSSNLQPNSSSDLSLNLERKKGR